MKRTVAFCSLFAFALLLQAQQTPTATVEGLVTQLGRPEPISNVRITFAPEKGTPRTVTTDRDGKFSATGLTAGRYTLTPARSGFIKPRRAAGPSTLTVTPGQRIQDVRFQLTAAGVISGRITDEKREPLRGIRVEARGYAGGGRRGEPIHGGGGQTNDRGEFRISGLYPGNYYVVADQSPEGGYSTTYYPGAADMETAVSVSVSAGSESGGIVFPLSTERHYVIRAKPAIPASWPASRGVEFRLHPKNTNIEEPWIFFRAAPNGVYESRPVRGAFELAVVVSSERGTLYGHVPVEVRDKDVNVGTIPLRAGFELRGRIATRDLQSSDLEFNRISVEFFTADETPWNFAPGDALAKADGSFVVPSVTTGKFRVSISGAPEGTYLEAVHFNGRDLGESSLTIDGEPRGTLELFVSRSAGTLQGIAQNINGQPIADATVVLVPTLERRSNPTFFKSAMTDQNGAFDIRSIPPGEYSLLAWEDIDPGTWLIPELLREFEGRAQKITIDRGSDSRHFVRVIPAATDR
jgi:hypothetical protein